MDVAFAGTSRRSARVFYPARKALVHPRRLSGSGGMSVSLTPDPFTLCLPLFQVSDCCFCCRVLLDRAHADVDGICQSLDADLEPEPLPGSPLRNPNTSTSETNTSDPASSSHLPSSLSPHSPSSQTPLDLSQILLNIKSCRWRHFRPRTLSQHPSGGGDLSRRGFRDFSRTVSGLTRTLSGGASSQNRTGPAPPPVNGECLVFSGSPLCVFCASSASCV